MTYTT